MRVGSVPAAAALAAKPSEASCTAPKIKTSPLRTAPVIQRMDRLELDGEVYILAGLR